MSNRTFNELWIRCQRDLQGILSEEHQLSHARPEKDREVAFQSVSRIYLQYVQLLRNLETCYDQIVHPQKRILLRQLLEANIGRILELKHELVGLDNLEYSYHDANICDLRMSPEETEIVIPRFVLRDREKEIAYWGEQMAEAMAKIDQGDGGAGGSKMSAEEAVLLLQRHERARQGRLRAKLMQEIRRQEEAVADKAARAKARAEETLTQALAARKIQSIWKGALTRRHVKKLREEELAFIGMIPPAEFPSPYADRLRSIESDRRRVQSEHHSAYERALVDLREELRERDGQEIEEEMKEQIRKWFFEDRDDQGKFPDYPSDDEGGSASIFHPERLRAAAAAAAANGANRAAAAAAAQDEDSDDGRKDGGGGEQDKAKAKPKKTMEEKSGGGGDKKGKEAEDEEESGFTLRSSDFVKQLRRGQKTFEEIWIKSKGIHVEGVVKRTSSNVQDLNDRCFATFETWKNVDESHNKRQTYDREMILEAKRVEVEEEIRLRVDALMREELDILKMAAERDKGKKGKLAKKRKKGKKKASKKGKKKKDKDLTPDRTLESLFEELVVNGIVRKAPDVPLARFIGGMNNVATIVKKKQAGGGGGGAAGGGGGGNSGRGKNKDPNPGPSDIRRTVAEYCILPMSSTYLRETTPHVKSLLLVGPEGSGKTMLLDSICTELSATLFDLTATNIVGKYPGKSGLNMLLHLVIKVSKLMQPSVIFIDQAEKTFLKKVSKTDKSDPKRLKKDLPRLVRSLAPEDRVLLIGASRCPWECEQKGLTQAYQKILMLPKPDYGHRYSLWKEFIVSKGGKIMRWSDRFDISALSKISDGYTAGQIESAVTSTLTERRLMQQNVKALRPHEFVAGLAASEPVYREEEEMYASWYSKTPMGKRRSKYVDGDEEETKKEKKKSAAGGGKKKK